MRSGITLLQPELNIVNRFLQRQHRFVLHLCLFPQLILYIRDLDRFIKQIIENMYPKISNYERDYASDECALSAEEQREQCWSKKGNWHTYVADKFQDWQLDAYPFLNLHQLTDSTKQKLQTCTLGQFVTVASFVDAWDNAKVTNSSVL